MSAQIEEIRYSLTLPVQSQFIRQHTTLLLGVIDDVVRAIAVYDASHSDEVGVSAEETVEAIRAVVSPSASGLSR